MLSSKRFPVIFSRLILLFFVLKTGFPEAVETSSLVIGNSAEPEIEDLLTEFITDLKKSSFEESHHQRLVVLGRREDFLQASKSLLESGTPYAISTKAEATVLPAHFGAESVVLFFIDGFTDSQTKMAFGKLPNDYACKAMIISMEENRRDDRSITAAIASAVKTNLRNVLFAHFDGHGIEIWGKDEVANCVPEIRLVNKWTPRKGFLINGNVLGVESAKRKKRGCPMFVSTFESPPTMMLRKDANKTLHITGGPEGRLVETVAEYLNVVPVVKEPSVEEQLWVSPNGTLLGIVGDVAREAASFGIGQIRPTPERAKIVDLTTPYSYECIVWTVPLRFKPSYNVVVSEFPPSTWTLVILSVSLCCGLAYVIPKLRTGCGSSSNVFDAIAVTLSQAIPRQPSDVLSKLFFLLYLHYSRVITTAYSTSLSSILATSISESAIVDEEGIITAGLGTAGTQSGLELLADQISPNGTRVELISRYEIITSIEAALGRITDRQDVAYLRHRSTITHAANKLLMAGKPPRFRPLPGCVISYNSVTVTAKGSSLTGRVNDIVLRLGEAGIYNHWTNLDVAYESQIKTPESNDNTLDRLQSIFILYLCCLVPAFLAFISELVVFELRFHRFERKRDEEK